MSTLVLIGVALLVLIVLVGMVANGFTVLFICIDWLRSRRLSTTDLLLCCLSLSRLIWLAIVIWNAAVASFFKHMHLLTSMSTMISMMWLFTNTINLWLAAWLSVLYFVKISSFSHPVFLQVKQRFPGLVPWLLLGSAVYSAAVSIMAFAVSAYVFSTDHLYKSCSSNSNNSAAIQTLSLDTYLIILSSATNFIPFVLFLSSSVLLINSLRNHLRHMRCSRIGAMDLSTQAHLTAIKALASFAVLYLFSYIIVTLQSMALIYMHPWTGTILDNLSTMYPAGHSIILILINPKLKKAWVGMLRHFKCRLSEIPS